MTTPQRPEGQEPLGEQQMRQKAREILADLITGGTGSSVASQGGRPPGRRRLVVLGAILGVLLLGLGVDALLESGLLSPRAEIPDELVGVWGTAAPAYADRTFEITKTLIAFDTGGLRSSVFSIKKVTVAQDPAGTLYTIDYATSDDQVAEFSFLYMRGREGLIRFKNQQQLVWTKAKP